MIFLGDAGAYFIGFNIAVLTILLSERNVDISPWCIILLLFYPLMETLFSIYRKIRRKGYSPGKPDGVHLHMIVYKRLIQRINRNSKFKEYNNAMTSVVLWIFPILSLVFSVLFYNSTILSVVSIFFLGVTYLFIYSKLTLQQKIIKFQK